MNKDIRNTSTVMLDVLKMLRYFDDSNRIILFMKFTIESNVESKFFASGFLDAIKKLKPTKEKINLDILLHSKFHEFIEFISEEKNFQKNEILDVISENDRNNLAEFLSEKNNSGEWSHERCGAYFHGFLFLAYAKYEENKNLAKEQDKDTVDSFLGTLSQ